MYVPITTNQAYDAELAMRGAIEMLLSCMAGFAHCVDGSHKKEQRTIAYQVYCRAARKAANALLERLPSDERIERMVK